MLSLYQLASRSTCPANSLLRFDWKKLNGLKTTQFTNKRCVYMWRWKIAGFKKISVIVSEENHSIQEKWRQQVDDDNVRNSHDTHKGQADSSSNVNHLADREMPGKVEYHN